MRPSERGKRQHQIGLGEKARLNPVAAAEDDSGGLPPIVAPATDRLAQSLRGVDLAFSLKANDNDPLGKA